jgi:hypothetical protein
MVIEWRERECEEVDATVERDARAQIALKNMAFIHFGISKE